MPRNDETRASRRRRRDAMTLVEIMIVVIIMALIAAAVGAAVIPRFLETQDKAARIDAETIRGAAEQFLGTHVGEGCPTVDALVEARILSSRRRTTDPWGHEFRLDCVDGEVDVVSAGADGEFGTDDDVR